jgi:hypothetical protein
MDQFNFLGEPHLLVSEAHPMTLIIIHRVWLVPHYRQDVFGRILDISRYFQTRRASGQLSQARYSLSACTTR